MLLLFLPAFAVCAQDAPQLVDVADAEVAATHISQEMPPAAMIDLDMHDLAGGDEWLAAAERYARQGIENLYCNGLFRGATGLWYYESELWVSTLVYALVRLHSEVTDAGVRVKPSYFHR